MKTIFGRTKENWYLEKLPESTLVKFEIGTIKGTGYIRGIAAQGQPIIGVTYIIELLSIIDSVINEDNMDEYTKLKEYSHIAIPEIYLDVI